MDPINYDGALANVQSPVQAFTQGLQGGLALQQVQQAQVQQQAALARQQSFQADVAALGTAPTAAGIAQLSIKYPEHSEDFKRSLDMLTPAQQQAKIDAAGPVHAAVLAGEYGIAAKQLREHADALQNSGQEQEAKQTRAMADMVEQHPETAKLTTGMLLASAMGPERYTKAFGDIGTEDRTAEQAPAALRTANAKAGAEEADATAKNLGIVAQQAGALAKPGIKPAQAITMFKSLEARGIIPKGGAQGYIDGMPSGEKDLPDYLKQIQASGVKADDQMKFTTPTADAALSANTQIQATGMNNRTSLAVQDRIDARAKAESEGSDDVASFTSAAIDNAAERYNVDGTLPPMGMGKAAAAGRTKILNRAAELKAGISGEQQRRDQLGNKGEIASQTKAVKEFTSGKLGSSVRSFNVGLAHLDTLGQLADAMGNKDTQAVNRLGNYFATQTGSDAPVKFEAAKKVVTDEIVKAIVGAGGTGHDREEAAKTVSSASSPAQLRGVINTYKDLMVGQLGGLDQQYRTSTGRDDFHKYLSPQAQTLYGKHGGGSAPASVAAAPALPAGWSVREH